jgi:hypothetical protein
MRALQYVLTILAGVVVGVLAQLAYQCTSTWHHGGSADPRCVFEWKGYVEVHHMNDPKPDLVSCQYRPEIFTP